MLQIRLRKYFDRDQQLQLSEEMIRTEQRHRYSRYMIRARWATVISGSGTMESLMSIKGGWRGRIQMEEQTRPPFRLSTEV